MNDRDRISVIKADDSFPVTIARDGIEDVFADVNVELARQASRKISLEQRGITVITTSSVLATIVFTVTATITKINGAKNFTTFEHILITIGVALFLLAAMAALFVNFPRSYGEVDPESIIEVAAWAQGNRNPKVDTHLQVTDRLVQKGIDDLTSWQKHNGTKARALWLAFAFEVVAVIPLLVAIIALLLSRS